MSVALALPGITLGPGDHVCGFYYGEEERDAMLLPFLRGAMDSGDKCVAVVDSVRPADVMERLGLDLEDCVSSGRLEMYDSSQTYLRTGSFDAEAMIAFWESRARAARDEGRFSFAWVLGEMSWLDRVDPRP